VITLLVTITKQGKAKDIIVVKSFDDRLAVRAVQAVRRWQFKTANGLDGKALAVRVPVAVVFRLSKPPEGLHGFGTG
jgi:TonB family protein